MEEKKKQQRGKMLLLASDIKRGKSIWKRPSERSKRRLRNFEERNDCQLSRYGGYRSMTDAGFWGGGGGGRAGVILIVLHLVYYSYV